MKNKELLFLLVAISYFSCSTKKFVNISSSNMPLEFKLGTNSTVESENLESNIVELQTYYRIEGKIRRGQKVGTWKRYHGQDSIWSLMDLYYFGNDIIVKNKSYYFNGNLHYISKRIDEAKCKIKYFNNLGRVIKTEIKEEEIVLPLNFDDTIVFEYLE
jgi:hypothetical protein